MRGYVENYNNVRLNSVIGYITPKDMLAWRQAEFHAQRDRKLRRPRTAPDSSAKGRVKNDEPTFGVAGKADNFRIADNSQSDISVI